MARLGEFEPHKAVGAIVPAGLGNMEPFPFSQDEVVSPDNSRPMTFDEWMSAQGGDTNVADVAVSIFREEVAPAVKGLAKIAKTLVSPTSPDTLTNIKSVTEGMARGATDVTSVGEQVVGAIGDKITKENALRVLRGQQTNPEQLAHERERERKREYGRYVSGWHYNRGREGGVVRQGFGAYIPDSIKQHVTPEIKEAFQEAFAPDVLDPDVIKAGEYIDPLDLTLGTAATKVATKAMAKRTAQKATKQMATVAGNGIDHWSLETLKNWAQPLSARVEKHSPEVANSIRRFFLRTQVRAQNAQDVLGEFLHEAKAGLSKKDMEQMFYQLAKGDRMVVNTILEKKQYGKVRESIYKKLSAVDEVNAKFLNDAREAGMDVGQINDYWARRINDDKYKKFVKDKGINVSERKWRKMFAEAEADYGRPLDDADKAALINAELTRPQRQGLPSASNVKQRQVDDLSYEDYKKYYDSADASMAKYYDNMATAIEKRRFFATGTHKPPRKKGALLESGDRLPGERRPLTEDQVWRLEDSVGDWMQRLVDEGKIGLHQMDDLSSLVGDVFAGAGKTGKISKGLSMLTYGAMMGQFDTAALQLTDLAIESAKSGKSAVRGLTRKNFQKDVGLQSIGLEGLQMDIIDKSLRDGVPAKAIDKMFKATGLRQVDALMKGMSARAGLDKFLHLRGKGMQSAEVQKFINEQRKWFGEDAVKLAEDISELPAKIADADLTEDMRLLMLNNLSQHQPITIFEYPKWYVRNGNFRFAYALKSFMFKYIDNLNRMTLREWKAGNKKAAIKNAVRLGSFMAASQTGFELSREFVYDQIRALADGRTEDLGEFYRDKREVYFDAITDGMLNAIGMNKYLIDKGAGDPITTAADFVIGPSPKIGKTLVGTAQEMAEDVIGIGDLEPQDYKAMKHLPIIDRGLDRTYGGYRQYLDSGSSDPTLNPLKGALPSIPSGY